MTTEHTTEEGRPVLLDIDDMNEAQGRMLAVAVADLLVRGGGISGDMPLTGGHLMMFTTQLADELERMRSRPLIDALDAAHFHVDANDAELTELGITREDALTAARILRDEADPVVEREARWAKANTQ